jgi:hypothetical protein
MMNWGENTNPCPETERWLLAYSHCTSASVVGLLFSYSKVYVGCLRTQVPQDCDRTRRRGSEVSTPYFELYPAVLTDIFVFTRSFQASVGLYSQTGRYRSIPLHSMYSQITICKHVIVTRRVPYASSRKAFDSVRCWCKDIGTQPVCIHRCSRFQEICDRNFIGRVPKEILRQVFIHLPPPLFFLTVGLY